MLYVVDSVTRQWVEAARKAGQVPGGDAPDGTFAAGVKRVTDLLPILMTDIINNAPQDQKVRNRKNLYHDKPRSPASQPWRWPSLAHCILCLDVLQSEDHVAFNQTVSNM